MPDGALHEPAELTRALIAGRPLAYAPAERIVEVTWTRSPAPPDWHVDGDSESPAAEHRAAHADSRTSEAVVRYGAGVAPEAVAERLLSLAELAAGPGGLQAVCPVPGAGDAARPGSWGVEDLTMIALTRRVLPDVPWVRPCWRLLGPAACQVAVGFGANDWLIPPDDPTDPDHLARALGCRAVAR